MSTELTELTSEDMGRRLLRSDDPEGWEHRRRRSDEGMLFRGADMTRGEHVAVTGVARGAATGARHGGPTPTAVMSVTMATVASSASTTPSSSSSAGRRVGRQESHGYPCRLMLMRVVELGRRWRFLRVSTTRHIIMMRGGAAHRHNSRRRSPVALELARLLGRHRQVQTSTRRRKVRPTRKKHLIDCVFRRDCRKDRAFPATKNAFPVESFSGTTSAIRLWNSSFSIDDLKLSITLAR